MIIPTHNTEWGKQIYPLEDRKIGKLNLSFYGTTLYYRLQSIRMCCTVIFDRVTLNLLYPCLVFSFQYILNEISHGGGVLFRILKLHPLTLTLLGKTSAQFYLESATFENNELSVIVYKLKYTSHT